MKLGNLSETSRFPEYVVKRRVKDVITAISRRLEASSTLVSEPLTSCYLVPLPRHIQLNAPDKHICMKKMHDIQISRIFSITFLHSSLF